MTSKKNIVCISTLWKLICFIRRSDANRQWNVLAGVYFFLFCFFFFFSPFFFYSASISVNRFLDVSRYGMIHGCTFWFFVYVSFVCFIVDANRSMSRPFNIASSLDGLDDSIFFFSIFFLLNEILEAFTAWFLRADIARGFRAETPLWKKSFPRFTGIASVASFE